MSGGCGGETTIPQLRVARTRHRSMRVRDCLEAVSAPDMNPLNRPSRRRGPTYLLIAVSAAAAMAATLALGGAAATSATLYPCAGAPPDAPQTMYPEKRYYLETQAWWSPMPGHSPIEPFQDRTGHVHIGACVPLYQTVSGGNAAPGHEVAAAHDARRQRQGAPLPLSFIVNIEGIIEGVNLQQPRPLEGRRLHHDAVRRLGQRRLRLLEGTVGLGEPQHVYPGLLHRLRRRGANCRQLRTLNHWPVNFSTRQPAGPCDECERARTETRTPAVSRGSRRPRAARRYARVVRPAARDREAVEPRHRHARPQVRRRSTSRSPARKTATAR